MTTNKALSTSNSPYANPPLTHRTRQNLLSVDSSNLGNFSLEAPQGLDPFELERREQEEAEMAAAMREVERLRLEMQRQAERATVAEGVDLEGTVVVKKKRKKKKRIDDAGIGEYGEGETNNGAAGDHGDEAVVRKKKKKKRLNEAGMADQGSADAGQS